MFKKILLASLLIFGYGITPSFATQNIPVEYSQYLNISQNDRIVGMQTDGESVYIAVAHLGASYPQNLSRILVFHTRNRQFQNEIGTQYAIQDFRVENGKIYIAHNAWVQVLNTFWTQQQTFTLGNIQKLAVSSAWDIATINDRKEMVLISSYGNIVKTVPIIKTSLEAVAFDARNGRIFVAGYDNKLVDGRVTTVAFIHAYDMQGNFVYKIFDFETYEFGQNFASTKITDIFSENDGNLYVLWETTGKNTIFRYNGKQTSGYSPIVNIDDYSDIEKASERKIAYIAKISSFDGTVQMAQFSYPRGTDSFPTDYDTGNGKIIVDRSWDIIFSGNTAFSTPDFSSVRVGNDAILQHATTNGTLQALSSNMQSRYLWTSFSRSGNPTNIQDIAFLNNTTLAILGTSQSAWDIFTTQSGGNSNAFLMLMTFSKNTSLPKYQTPTSGIQYPTNPPNTPPTVTPPNNSQIERPYVTPNGPYTAQEGRNLAGLQKYFDNIQNTLNNPSLTNLQKLEVVKVNPITPRDPKALKLYILLAGEFNRKKDHLLNNRRTITRSELDTLYKYTLDLYNVAMTMDQKMSRNILVPYVQELLRSYQAMNQIK